jgi:FixJ family two-component response regulator
VTMIASSTRVAILDDDQSVRTAIGRLLRTSQMEVDAFATSIELFNAIERQPPNCIVLDLQMPGMDGIDVLRFLSQCGVHIPTIVITAHDEAATRNRCLGAGAVAYLRKPLDGDELLKTIKDAVAHANPLGPTSN